VKIFFIGSSAIALGVILAYNMSENRASLKEFSAKSKSNQTQVSQKIKKQTPIEFLQTNGIEAIKPALENNKINSEQFKAALITSINKFGKCLKDKSCLLKSQENKFHDPNNDPVFLKIKNLLDGIEYVSFTDPEILDEIENQQLYDLMQFENPASFHLAKTLVFNKGRKAILGSKSLAENLSSHLLGSYLKLVSDESLLEDLEIRELRNDLIDGYISSSDTSKMLTTLNTINALHFNVQEAQDIKESYCTMSVRGSSEAAKVLNAKFTRFVMKYNIASKC
jgi:hypothetical protein